jgi:tripartite-type tricarboxylate transporter receptor subunit TctC
MSRLRLDAVRSLCFALTLTVGAAAVSSAGAQTYPPGPVQLVVTTAAGGSGDFVARAFAERLSEELGQPVIIENQPTGNGNLAVSQVARAKPDGQTLLFTNDSTLTVNPHLYKNMAVNPFRDLSPISTMTRMDMVLTVNAQSPFRSVKDVIDEAKKNPGKLNYASTGLGTQLHIGLELFKAKTKTDIVHVPYRGNTGAMADLMGGRVEMILIGVPGAKAQMDGGRLRVLAVAASKRAPLLPDVPTMAEAGVPDYEVSSWYGALAPAKTPQPILDRLSAAARKIAADPRFVSTMGTRGMEVVGNTPAEMTGVMRADSEKWGRVIADTGTKVE